MNDGIMYTHNVVRHDSHGNETLFVCAKLETAEYLCAWEQAVEENRFIDWQDQRRKTLGLSNWECAPTISLVERMRAGLDKFSIVEGEVIL